MLMVSFTSLTLSNLLHAVKSAVTLCSGRRALPNAPKPSVEEGKEPSEFVTKLPGKLFALIIGINKYQHHKPLVGAVRDANHIESFLARSLSVPNSRIKKLLDADATRIRIIKEIKTLHSHPDIEVGDPILIYFAGHGARSEVPDEYKAHSTDGKLETICPVDMTCRDMENSPVAGIPDVFLDLLIRQLATKKGNNIILILDCCHPSNVARRKSNVHIRGIGNPPPLSVTDLALDLADSRMMNAQKFPDCSVVLAACKKDEHALEYSKGGLFSEALLKHLRGFSDHELNQLTYKRLIQTLKISDSQHPRCEGLNVQRYLFRTESPNGSFISGYKDGDGKYVLEAGKNFDFSLGDEFDIYDTNVLFTTSRQLCSLRIDDVGEEKSPLASPDVAVSSMVPDQFYALRTCLAPEQKIKFYSTDFRRLSEVLLHHEQDYLGFASPVATDDEAELHVSFEAENVRLCWGSRSVVTVHAEKFPIGDPIRSSQKDVIASVFQAAARFHNYLRIGEVEPEESPLKLEFWRLQRQWRRINGVAMPFWVPSDQDLLHEDFFKISLVPGTQEGPFGLNISNTSQIGLYPHVFWFDARTLEITPWFSHQVEIGSQGINGPDDAPLQACVLRNEKSIPGSFSLGYGENNIPPWGFTLQKADDIDVGFFKVMATSVTVDLTPLGQASPFKSFLRPERGGGFGVPNTNLWLTRTATVVQVRRLLR